MKNLKNTNWLSQAIQNANEEVDKQDDAVLLEAMNEANDSEEVPFDELFEALNDDED